MQISFSGSGHLRGWIDRQAAATNVSRSEYIERAMEAHRLFCEADRAANAMRGTQLSRMGASSRNGTATARSPRTKPTVLRK